MKSFISSLLAAIVCSSPAFAQPQPAVTTTQSIPVATLEVGYYTTTALVFPAAIVDGDKGYRDLLASPQSKVSNVLNLKAAVKYFVPTNLHVYTSDQKVYTFRVVYVDSPAVTTYDVATLPQADKVRANSQLSEAGGLLNENALQRVVTTIRNAKSFVRKSAANDDVWVQLQTIHQVGENLFFKFTIRNNAFLSYQLDFVRAYITDKQKGKRSSLQQRELIPAYQDSIPAFDNRSEVSFIIAIPRFSLTENKRFHFEFFERNGGRHVKLSVKNRQLYKAQVLPTHSIY
jgi:conjugative transposon TraN protein